MKLIAPFFQTSRMDFSLQISTKINKNTPKEIITAEKNKPMIKTYISKSGYESLIFNPTVALVIKRNGTPYTNDAQVVAPIHLVYQLGGIIGRVYKSLMDTDWYYKDDDQIHLVSAEVAKRSRRISLFKSMLTLGPTLINDMYVTNEIGIYFMKEGIDLGCLTHYEANALIDTINHMDITTYSLLAGLTEKVDQMDKKIDLLLQHFKIQGGVL